MFQVFEIKDVYDIGRYRLIELYNLGACLYILDESLFIVTTPDTRISIRSYLETNKLEYTIMGG